LLCVVGCAVPPQSDRTLFTVASRASMDDQDAEWRRIAEKAFKRYSPSDSCGLRSEGQYLRSMALRAEGEFEKAWDEAYAALMAWPEDLDARQLFSELTWVVTGERLVAGRRIMVERSLIEVRKLVRRGECLLDAGEPEWAVREFLQAESALKRLPIDESLVQELDVKLQEHLREARAAVPK